LKLWLHTQLSAIGLQWVLGYAEASGPARAVRPGWEVTGTVKKVLTWLGIAFVIYYLATNPHGAANVVTGALNWLKTAGNSLAQFLNHIKL
jgi:hypothetical protein